MSKAHLEFAVFGEGKAVDFLKSKGYKIIGRNYKTKFGEIDIIAREKDTLVFIEVKARRTAAFAPGQAAVNKFKQNQISRAALIYLKTNCLLNKRARFDIVSIRQMGETLDISLIRNAFELDSRFVY